MQVHVPHPQAPRRRPTAVQAEGERTDGLELALAQKTALLNEVDHRVKNNLQLISSLLLLQARRSADVDVRRALQSAQARVNAVAIVHRRLFQGDNPEWFDAADFLRDMAADVIAASGRGDIRIRQNLNSVILPVAQAAPLALVVGELLRNSVEHAFPEGRSGHISISCGLEDDNLRIEIADDGVGLTASDDSTGFGRTIVKLLSEQLHAKCEAANANPGVRTVLRLPAPKTV